MPGGLLSQLRALKEKLSINQILSIAALGTVILCGVLAFVYLLHREPYQTLFTEMDAEEANSVVQKLKELEIPYQLSHGSRTILVPAGSVDQAVMELASAGLPNRGRIGFEIFDETQWGVTEFAEKIKYRRALEGELERTIVSLSEISYARVHLVMEKESLFVRDTQPAKASVAVRLKRGVKLGSSRVTGISNLVAFAVEGLTPGQVTVVDVSGNLLSKANRGDEVSGVDQLQHQRKLESDLEAKVVSLLEPLVGRSRVRATASVRLDLNEVQQTETIYDPNGSVILSQTSTQEEFAPQEGPKSGIPFKANQPPEEAPPGTEPERAEATQAPGRSRRTSVVNYEVSKTLRELKSPRGSVQQISVAVVVDDKIKATAADAEGQATPVGEPRSPEEMERLTNLVRATIGYNAQRGDVVTVENVAFTGSNFKVEPVGEETWWEQYYPLVQPASRYLVVLAFFVLFYLLIFRPVKKRVFSYVELSQPELGQLAAGVGGDAELAAQVQGQLGMASMSGEAEVSEEAGNTKKELLSLAKEDPDRVTNLVRSWLSEGTASSNE